MNRNSSLYKGSIESWTLFFESALDYAKNNDDFLELFSDYNDENFHEALTELMEVKAHTVSEKEVVNLNKKLFFDLPESFIHFMHSGTYRLFNLLSLQYSIGRFLEVPNVKKYSSDKNFKTTKKFMTENSQGDIGVNERFSLYSSIFDTDQRVFLNIANIKSDEYSCLIEKSSVLINDDASGELLILPTYASKVVENEVWLFESGGDLLRFRSFAELIIWIVIASVTGKIEDGYEVLTLEDLKQFEADKLLNLSSLN